jgi:hypothetical protein
MDLETIYVLIHQIILEVPEERSLLVPIMSDIVSTLYPEYINAIRLFRNGYVVIPMLDDIDVTKWRSDLKSNIQSFPEYKNTKNPVLGGFAALGNAASFHHPDIRNKRHFVYNHIRTTLLRDYAIITGDEDTLKSELLFDRIMWRQSGQSPSRETWHRDVTVKPPKSSLQKGDYVLGGWTNLDDTAQYFSCVPGTHLDSTLFGTLNTGFSKISKENHNIFQTRSMNVTIPPGHCLIFFQHLVHEVLPSKISHDMYRIFHGVRLTHGQKPLFYDDYQQRKVFDDQAIPRLPSFQKPPMYSSNHGSVLLGLPQDTSISTNLIGKFTLPGERTKTNTVKWSLDTFHNNSIETKTRIKNGQSFSYQIVRRFMRSLREDGYPLYDAYTQKERSLYVPVLLFSNKKTVTFNSADIEYKDNDADCIRIQFQGMPMGTYFESYYFGKRVPSRNNKDRLVYMTYDYDNNRYCGTEEPDSIQMVLDHIAYVESHYEKYDNNFIEKQKPVIDYYKNAFQQRLN